MLPEVERISCPRYYSVWTVENHFWILLTSFDHVRLSGPLFDTFCNWGHPIWTLLPSVAIWVEIIRANGQKVRQLSNWKRSFSAVMCPRKYWGTHHEAVAENLWLCCGGCLVQVVTVWPLSPSKIVVVFSTLTLADTQKYGCQFMVYFVARALVEHPFEACGPNQASMSINVYCLFSITKASASVWWRHVGWIPT